MTGEISREEILAHLSDREWLMKLALERFSVLLDRILKYYHYLWDDQEEEPEKTIEFYPERGVLLYSYMPAEQKWPKRGPGSPWPGWTERHFIFLLESGQFAVVEMRSSSFDFKTSFFHDASSGDIYTGIEIWTAEQIEQNKEKLVEAILAPEPTFKEIVRGEIII